MRTYSRRSEHVSGRYFTLAPIRTSRQGETVDEHRRLVEQAIGARGERLCEIVLQTKNIAPRHDNMLWETMTAPD